MPTPAVIACLVVFWPAADPKAAVGRAVEALLKKHTVPGAAVAVIDGYAVAWAAGYGVAEAGGPAVTADTLFQMASVSKPVTGVAAAALAERKRIDLDADVCGHLKGWRLPPTPTPVTLRRLLGHRAGLTVHGFPGYAAGKPVPTLPQVLAGSPPANTPAVRYQRGVEEPVRYSGGGYCVAQLALTDHTGQPFPALMRTTVLDPLGLTRSTYEQPPPERLRGSAAAGHAAGGKPYPGKSHTYPEMAAAGLWAPAGDVAAVFADLAASWAGRPGKVLGRAAARDLFATGVGWPEAFVGDDFWAVHGGANAGFRCVVAVHPATGRGAVVQTNSDLGQAVIDPTLEAIRQAYGW